MNAPQILAGLSQIADGYDVLLCDVWGVIHNGRESFPSACEALTRFQRERGPVVLISNSPRPAEAVKPQLAELGVPDSANHPDMAAIRIARARLKAAAGLDVIELLQPRTIRRDARGRLLQASYVNFYLCNGGLIMPSFDDPHDVRARDTLAAAFPGRDITVVPALPIVAGGGGIHCITQQEPE